MNQTLQTQNLFDVVVDVHNAQGNLVFRYYPKAGVIEVKRNRIYSQITVSGLLDKGTQALAAARGGPLIVSLPEVPELTKK